VKIISKINLSLLLTISLTLNLYAQGYIAVGGGSEDYGDWVMHLMVGRSKSNSGKYNSGVSSDRMTPTYCNRS
jgi:hypothetical protein